MDHARVHERRGHEVAQTGPDPVFYSKPPAFAAPATCSKHVGVPLNHYCFTDNAVLCPECVVYDHPTTSHCVLKLDEAEARIRNSLPTLIESCQRAAHDVFSVTRTIEGEKTGMIARLESTIAAFRDKLRELHQAVDAVGDAVIIQANRVCSSRVKALDAQMEELMLLSSRGLDAAEHASFALQRQPPVQVLPLANALQGLESAYRSLQVPSPRLQRPAVATTIDIVCDTTEALHAVHRMARLRKSGADPSKCIVSGSGVLFCTRDPADATKLHGLFHVTCCDFEGELADGVVPDDVIVRVSPDSSEGSGENVRTTVALSSPGVLRVEYVVEDGESVASLRVSVWLSGQLVSGCPWTVDVLAAPPPPLCSGQGKFVRSVPVNTEGAACLLVSPDEQHVIVVYEGRDILFQVLSTADGHVVQTVVNGPSHRASHFRACLTPVGTLLLSDSGAHTVDELTFAGSVIRTIAVHNPWGIAASSNFIALGNARGQGDCVEMYDFASGSLLRSFGAHGHKAGQIAVQCDAIRISTDERRVIVAEHYCRVSMFAVSGEFITQFGVGTLSAGFNDVEWGAGDAAIVCDAGNSRICVFDVSSGDVLRTFDGSKQDCGHFNLPCALAAANRHLYVLDSGNQRVAVFE
jgi:hypothetical protein